MSRRRSAFRQRDVTRAIKAARAAGVRIRIEIQDGKMVIDTVSTDTDVVSEPRTELEQWKANRARSA